MTPRRVVVTGIGLVSALALNAQEHFERLLRGESAVAISAHPEFRDYPVKLDARVSGFERSALIGNRTLRKLLSPSAGYAVAAAGEALRDAGLQSCDPELKACGLYVGSIAVDTDPEVFIPAFRASLDDAGDFEIDRFGQRGMKLLDPLFLVKSLPNAGLCGISVEHQVLGSNANITNGPVSGLQAVAAASAAIARGEIEMAVAGGYDSLLRMDIVAGHIIAGRLSQRRSQPQQACRPFDRERDGCAAGEGAALLLLEAESHARARSARVYGGLLAIAQTTGASLVPPLAPGNAVALEQAARQVLHDARCLPAELGAIFGDGLATEEDDLREAAVVRHITDGHAVPYTSATPAMGFTGAASGVFSLAHALLALDRQVIPPLINCFRQDPRCKLLFYDSARQCRFERALVWNSDCGIKNVAVLVGSGRG